MAGIAPARDEQPHHDTDSPEWSSVVSSTIETLDLSPDQLSVITSYLEQDDSSEEDKKAFAQLLSQSNPAIQQAVARFLETNPTVSLSDLADLVSQLVEHAGPEVLALLEDSSYDLFALLARINEDDQNGIADLVESIEALAAKSDGAASSLLFALQNYVTHQTSGPLDSAVMAAIFSDYAQGPAPARSLGADHELLQKINDAFDGAGEFTLLDLHQLGLDSADGANDQSIQVQQILNALSSVGSGSFDSVEAIMAFVAQVQSAGGSDPVQILTQLGEVDNALSTIKMKLGLGPEDSLLGGYESYVLQQLAQGLADGNLQHAVTEIITHIESAMPHAASGDLLPAEALAYQSEGYLVPSSEHPLSHHSDEGSADAEPSDRAATDESGSTVPDRPGSAQDTGSMLGDIAIPPLSDNVYGNYDDIKDSPLFSEEQLQNEFHGDVEAYGKYLAQAHYILEEVLGIKPQDYDGSEGAPLTEKEVRSFLVRRCSDAESLQAEIEYINAVRDDLRSDTENASGIGPGDSGTSQNNPDFVQFDAIEYVQSLGEAYIHDVSADIVRPPSKYPEFKAIPTWVTNGLMNAYTGLEGAAKLHSAEFEHNQAESQAQEEIMKILREAEARGGSKPDGEVELTEDERTRIRELELDRLVHGNIQDFIESKTKLEGKVGDEAPTEDMSRYYDEDGNIKIAYSETGEPLRNAKGEPLTVIELDAIKEYATPAQVKEMIPNIDEAEITTENGFKWAGEETDETRQAVRDYNIEALEENRENFEFYEVNIWGTTVAHLQVDLHERQQTAITNIGDGISKDIEKISSKIEKFLDTFEQVLDIYVKIFESRIEDLRASYKYLTLSG